MTGEINVGDNYEVDEDSNGDLIIRHTPSGDTIRYDSAAGGFVGDDFTSLTSTDQFASHGDVAIRVPSDYDTLNEALHLNHRVHSSDLDIVINIESGHAITQPVDLRNGDWSHIEIYSQDATVPVASTFPSDQPVITVRDNATSPEISTKIDCQGNGTDGVVGKALAEVSFQPGLSHGIINAANNNVILQNGALFHGYSNDFSGAGENGVRASRGVIGSLGGTDGADVSNATAAGLSVDHASVIRAENIDASDCGAQGIEGTRGAVVSAPNATATNTGARSIQANANARINAGGSTLSSTGFATVSATSGSQINISGSTVTGDEYGVDAERARIVVADASITGSATDDIRLRFGSIVHAHNTDTSASSSSGNSPDLSDSNASAINTIDGNIGILWA